MASELVATRKKVQRLRESGVVAVSRFAVRSTVVLVVSALILSFSGRGTIVLQPFADACDLEAGAKKFGEIFLLVVVVLSVSTVCAGVLSTVIQSRMAAGWRLLARGVRDPSRRGAVSLLMQVCIVGVLGCVACRYVMPDVLYTLRIAAPGPQLTSHLGEIAGKICKVVVVAATVLAILAVFVYRATFLFQHRERARHK